MLNNTRRAKGSVIVFSEGEYSDFGYCGILVTLQQIDLSELAEKYKTDHVPRYLGDDAPRGSDFPSYLVANGYAMPVDYTEIHVGSYGRFELS